MRFKLAILGFFASSIMAFAADPAYRVYVKKNGKSIYKVAFRKKIG